VKAILIHVFGSFRIWIQLVSLQHNQPLAQVNLLANQRHNLLNQHLNRQANRRVPLVRNRHLAQHNHPHSRLLIPLNLLRNPPRSRLLLRDSLPRSLRHHQLHNQRDNPPASQVLSRRLNRHYNRQLRLANPPHSRLANPSLPLLSLVLNPRVLPLACRQHTMLP